MSTNKPAQITVYESTEAFLQAERKRLGIDENRSLEFVLAAMAAEWKMKQRRKRKAT